MFKILANLLYVENTLLWNFVWHNIVLTLSVSVICWWFLQTVWTQFRPDKTSGLILIQTVLTLKVFPIEFLKSNLKNQQTTKIIKIFPSRNTIRVSNSLGPVRAWGFVVQKDFCMKFHPMLPCLIDLVWCESKWEPFIYTLECLKCP